MSDKLVFCNWDWRPAVLLTDGSAVAAIGEGEGRLSSDFTLGATWYRVDQCDVSHTAGVMSEEDWRETFREALAKAGPIPSKGSDAKVSDSYLALIREQNRAKKALPLEERRGWPLQLPGVFQKTVMLVRKIIGRL
jgi:hypothetical protein